MTPLYEFEKFVNGVFVPCSFNKETGLYRLRPRGKDAQVSHTLFFESERERWLRGDWYGLRFLALQNASVRCRVVYHGSKHQLAILNAQRWPDLFERALVLCSGQLAEQQNGWLFFKNVPRDIAFKLSNKLSVICEEA